MRARSTVLAKESAAEPPSLIGARSRIDRAVITPLHEFQTSINLGSPDEKFTPASLLAAGLQKQYSRLGRWQSSGSLIQMPDKSRRVLVCVTGLTPQVVTETVYALTQREAPWVPDEVHVLTTFTGAERAQLLLGRNGDGKLKRLCRDYGLENVQFSKRHVHVLTDSNGQPLDDIRDRKSVV